MLMILLMIFIGMLKYLRISKTCPICHKEFVTKLGHIKEKTCCSQQCANVHFSRKKTDEEKLHIKNKIVEYYSTIPKKEPKYKFKK